MTYVVRINDADEYELYAMEGEKVLPEPVSFYEVLRIPKMSECFRTEKKFGDYYEQVGVISIRELLLLPKSCNPIFASLQELRGEDYTWDHYCKARDEKLGPKRK